MAASINGVAQVVESGLDLPRYDYVSNAPTSTTDVFTFKIGGSSGKVEAVVTILYTDTTKATISTVTRTPQLA